MAQAQEVFLFQPTSISGCQLWLDAADKSTMTPSNPTNGTSITAWADKSTTGKTVTVSSAPKFLGSAANNNSVLVFANGPQVSTSLPTPIGPGDVCLIAVWSVTVGGTNTVLGIGPASAPSLGIGFSANKYNFYDFGVAGGESAYNTSSTNFYLIEIGTRISGVMQLFVNGTSYTAATNTTPTNQTSTTIYVGNGAFAINGNIAEILVYNTTVNTSQRQQLEGYLAWKWGLQGSLPASHPFKTYRPLAQTPFPTTIPVMPTIGSGTPGFSPSQVSGCSAWYDGADPLGTGTQPTLNTTLTTWFDKSGNRRNASGGVPPTFVSGGVSFNGTTQYYSINIPYPSNYSIFLVATNTTAAQCYFFARDSIGGSRYPTFIQGYIGAGIGLEWFEAVDRATIATTPVSPFMASVDHTQGGRIYGFYYGNESFNIPQTQAYNSAPWDTLGQAAPGINVGYYGGTMKELIFYSNVVTTTQRQQIEGYLAWKWGLQGNLPANHPYKRNPVEPFPIRTTPFLGSLNIWQPTRISGCQLWFDATDPLTVGRNGTSVTSWTSKGTNSLVISQSSSNPVYTFNVYNSLPTLRFSFSNTLPLSNATVSSSIVQTSLSYSIFLVHTPNANNSTPFAFLTGGLSRLSVVTPEGSNISFDGIGARLSYIYPSQAAYLNGALRMETFYSLSSTGFYRRDGTQLASGTLGSGAYNATQNFFIGGAVPNYPGYFYGGDICEVVWFNVGLTTFQIQQVEGYLAWKWGLQGSLPANHPYKLFPPSP